MNRLFCGCQIRIGIDQKAVVVERDLFLGLKNLEFSITAVFALDKLKRLPVEFLTGKVKEAECSKKYEGKKENKFLLLFSKNKEDRKRNKNTNNGCSLPVGEEWNEKEIDDQTCDGRPEGFQDVHVKEISFLITSVKNKKDSQGEAYEKSQ